MSNAAALPVEAAAERPISRRLDRDDWLMRGGIVLLLLWLGTTLVLPLWWLLRKSFEDDSGRFVGLAAQTHPQGQRADFDTSSTEVDIIHAIRSFYIRIERCRIE